MARRSFDVVDVTEILIHWHAGPFDQRGCPPSLDVGQEDDPQGTSLRLSRPG